MITVVLVILISFVLGLIIGFYIFSQTYPIINYDYSYLHKSHYSYYDYLKDNPTMMNPPIYNPEEDPSMPDIKLDITTEHIDSESKIMKQPNNKDRNQKWILYKDHTHSHSVRPDFKVPEEVVRFRNHLEHCDKCVTESCDDGKKLEALCPPLKSWWKSGDPLWSCTRLDPGFIYAPYNPFDP